MFLRNNIFYIINLSYKLLLASLFILKIDLMNINMIRFILDEFKKRI